MPQRYFLEKKSNIISGQDAHHIKIVMRMKNEDEIIVCYDNSCFLASINVDQNDVHFQIMKELKQPKSLDITIIQGLPKSPKHEVVTKYATIFGASSMIFTQMHRSIAKLENTDNKLKRLETIAKEAAELAHRFDVPHIEFKKSLDAIDFKQYDLVLLADENNKTTSLKEAVPKNLSNLRIAVIIGPEGGISEQERMTLLAKNVISVSLGMNILPTEIACLYALTFFSLENA
jgi:16S rRNA (uracil1498-N3)-methyltransferase